MAGCVDFPNSAKVKVAIPGILDLLVEARDQGYSAVDGEACAVVAVLPNGVVADLSAADIVPACLDRLLP